MPVNKSYYKKVQTLSRTLLIFGDTYNYDCLPFTSEQKSPLIKFKRSSCTGCQSYTVSLEWHLQINKFRVATHFRFCYFFCPDLFPDLPTDFPVLLIPIIICIYMPHPEHKGKVPKLTVWASCVKWCIINTNIPKLAWCF